MSHGKQKLEQVIFEYYLDMTNKENSKYKMKELLNILKNPPAGSNYQIMQIHDFMNVTDWNKVFGGKKYDALRQTLRKIQQNYREDYGTDLGTGDIGTDIEFSNPYVINEY